MLSTIALVVAGLSTANKIGLLSVGLAFVAFALISSFVLPRRNPNFPGRHLGLFGHDHGRNDDDRARDHNLSGHARRCDGRQGRL